MDRSKLCSSFYNISGMAQILTDSSTGTKQKLKNQMVIVDFLFGNLSISEPSLDIKFFDFLNFFIMHSITNNIFTGEVHSYQVSQLLTKIKLLKMYIRRPSLIKDFAFAFVDGIISFNFTDKIHFC